MRAPALAAAALLAVGLAPAPAPAQLMGLAEAGSEALKAVRSAAKDALLVKDMIGAKIVGPTGEKVGTVRDLVVIPGGQLVALVVSPDDLQHPILVPYKAAKISKAAKAASGAVNATVEIQLPQPLDKLRAGKAVTDLTDALGGLIPGTPKAKDGTGSGGG